jgi:rhodanese-related sulfurtransferase
LDEFANLEHAYAPPYSPALDPLAVAAFAAQNIEDGIEASSPEESFEGARVLDVRHPEEREARPIPNGETTEIPLAEIRQRVDELNGDGGAWLVTCERGTRSAEAVRILESKGISARYLGGGMRWQILAGKTTPAKD